MKKGSVFCISFAMCALLLAGMYGLSLAAVHSIAAPAQEEAVHEPLYAPGITILSSAAERGETPGTFLLLHLDFARERAAFLVLPGETAAEADGGLASLSSLWSEYGGRAAADALAGTLQIPVDRYLHVSPKELAALLDCLGTVDLTLEGEEGTPQRRLFDGSALAGWMESAAVPRADRAAVYSSLAENILTQRLPLLRGRDAEKIYRIAVNCEKNDLTAADFALRQSALSALPEGGLSVLRIETDGAYDETGERYFLSEKTLQEIVDVFAESFPE